jgi:dihydroflavonol-4-reductase
MPTQTVLITGISGFIAKHCAVELLTHGYGVRGTVRSLAKAEQVRATLGKHADVSGLEFVEADLNSDAGWDKACEDAWGVLHVASPFPLAQPKDENELIRPAVDGTLRVLKAAVAAGVKRFVQTSSTAAIMYGGDKGRGRPFTEDDWTDVNGAHVSAYSKSKTLAEKAARDFIRTDGKALHYSSVNPGFVLGPLLDNDAGSSADAIGMFLKGKYPGCPRLYFPYVDVRDIATMHRLALETSEPSGGRYLGVAGVASFKVMMIPIKAQLGEKARKVPVRELPDFVIKLIGLFDPAARGIVPDLGHVMQVDNSRTRTALRMDFRGVEEAAPAMARSLIENGLA